MSRKQTEPVPTPDTADYKVMPWVRAVRDAMYEETRGMDAQQFAEYVAARAAKVRGASKPA